MSKTKTITLVDTGEVLRNLGTVCAHCGNPGHAMVECTRLEEPRQTPSRTIYVYTVVRLTDSIEYEIGQRLEKAEVQQLCESKAWKVTIVGKGER